MPANVQDDPNYLRDVYVTNRTTERPYTVDQHANGGNGALIVDLDAEPQPVDLVVKWAGRRFTLPFGESTRVPYNAIIQSFGDPDARNTAREPERRREFERVRVKWGVNTFAEQAMRDIRQTATGLPDIEIRDMDGNPIFTPAQDPDGEHLTVSQVLASRNDDLEGQVVALSAELEKMRGMVAQVLEASEDDDEPPAKRTRQRAAANA